MLEWLSEKLGADLAAVALALVFTAVIWIIATYEGDLPFDGEE